MEPLFKMWYLVSTTGKQFFPKIYFLVYNPGLTYRNKLKIFL